jgi:rRNA maturation endonuclease Nob1
MRPPLWHLRCPRCETIFALPVWPDSCPRCQLGELTRIDPTGDAAVTYFAGTMR